MITAVIIFLILFWICLIIGFVLLIEPTDKTSAKKYCTNCGNKLNDEDNFCARCGTKVLKENNNE